MKTVKKGTEVTILHIMGETAERLLTPLENGNFRFDCDAYVVGTPVKGGFFHLRQAREIIPGKKLGNNFKKWPRLRRALKEAGVKPVHIPGGDIPIHYDDEIVIPNFSMSGSGFFVIKKSEIGTYLGKLPLDEMARPVLPPLKRRKQQRPQKPIGKCTIRSALPSALGTVYGILVESEANSPKLP